jgi:hypothetical protein
MKSIWKQFRTRCCFICNPDERARLSDCKAEYRWAISLIRLKK